MRNFLLLISFIVSQTFAIAQYPLSIDWSKPAFANDGIARIIPIENLDFILIEQPQRVFQMAAQGSVFQNGKRIIKKKINKRLGARSLKFEEIIYFQDKLIAFYSEKQQNLRSMYMQIFDFELDPIGDLIFISSFNSLRRINRTDGFNIVYSQNKKYLAIEYLLASKNLDFDEFGVSILDSNLTIIREQDFIIPFQSNRTMLESRHLTNDGKYALGVSLFVSKSEGAWRDFKKVERTFLYLVTKDTLKQIDLSAMDFRIFNFEISSNDSLLFVNGTYGQELSNVAMGIFYDRISLQTNRLEVSKITQFPLQILEDEKVNMRSRNFLNDYRTQPIEEGMFNYAFRGVFPQENGESIVVAEQYYFYEQNISDSRGTPQVTNHYVYNDILIYRVDSVGGIKWITKVPKEQHSINDYGFYSSIKCVERNGKVSLFFNDSRQNYNDFGEYENLNVSFVFPPRKKSMVLAHAEIDSNSGIVNRLILQYGSEYKGFVSLKGSQVNVPKRQILFYASSNKDTFGVLSY